MADIVKSKKNEIQERTRQKEEINIEKALTEVVDEVKKQSCYDGLQLLILYN